MIANKTSVPKTQHHLICVLTELLACLHYDFKINKPYIGVLHVALQFITIVIVC